jgi:hypothetical protein
MLRGPYSTACWGEALPYHVSVAEGGRSVLSRRYQRRTVARETRRAARTEIANRAESIGENLLENMPTRTYYQGKRTSIYMNYSIKKTRGANGTKGAKKKTQKRGREAEGKKEEKREKQTQLSDDIITLTQTGYRLEQPKLSLSVGQAFRESLTQTLVSRGCKGRSDIPPCALCNQDRGRFLRLPTTS